jgi:uncharacterized protein (DUF1684 family)
MHQRILILVSLSALSLAASAQKLSYIDSVKSFQQTYIDSHGVVLKSDKQYLQFFPVDSSYRVLCTFTPSKNAKWFSMKTSGNTTQVYRKYGLLTFKIHDTVLQLHVYQSQSLMSVEDYADYLFIPFTDKTTGKESYGGGRYIDHKMNDIRNNNLLLDFNKAYNPYCAYAEGYDCPIPPAENDLPVKIKAGEAAYGKKH